eukprot:1083540-Rhodomonas_salina.3
MQAQVDASREHRDAHPQRKLHRHRQAPDGASTLEHVGEHAGGVVGDGDDREAFHAFLEEELGLCVGLELLQLADVLRLLLHRQACAEQVRRQRHLRAQILEPLRHRFARAHGRVERARDERTHRGQAVDALHLQEGDAVVDDLGVGRGGSEAETRARVEPHALGGERAELVQQLPLCAQLVLCPYAVRAAECRGHCHQLSVEPVDLGRELLRVREP